MSDFLAAEDRALLERHGLATFDALWALRTVAVRVSCATHYAPEQIAAWTASPVPASYAAMLAAGGGIVAMLDGAIAGYAMLDADKQEVDAVFVDPARAGLGIGKRLLKARQHLEHIDRAHLFAELVELGTLLLEQFADGGDQ